MKNIKHLTQHEILAFANDSLAQCEANEIGRHLLQCERCRKLLPLPSVEQFWAAITTEIEPDYEPLIEKSKLNMVSTVSTVSSFLKLQSGLLWGGATLMILLSFSVLLWLSLVERNKEVAQIYESDSSSKINFPLPLPNPTNEKPSSSTNSNRVVVNPTPKIVKTEVPKQKIVENTSPRNLNKPNLIPQNVKIAATRGVSSKCAENNSIELEFLANKENFVFKWKAIPKAVKYHLYISDDEEILIDEFETESETTFTLKKALDPLKTYKWKIIVTLENGNKVIGESQKFTTKNFQTHQIKSEKRNNSDVRCPANQ